MNLEPLTTNSLKRLKSGVFSIMGGRMYAPGYGAYRELRLRDYSHRSFNGAALPAGYGRCLDERVVEYPWLLSRLPKGSSTLLDAGSALNFDFLLSHPRLAEKKLFISTLAPEDRSFWSRSVSYVYEDLRCSCFRDNYFDLIVSLSTIEHIGLDNTLFYTGDPAKREHDANSWRSALREFRRILKPGGRLYLSVPFGRYQNLGWLQVFDSVMLDHLRDAFQANVWIETIFQYEGGGWRRSCREAARSAGYFDCHHQQPTEGCPAAAEAVACIELD